MSNLPDCREQASDSEGLDLRQMQLAANVADNQRPAKNKVNSFMARSLKVENLLPQNVRLIINYLQ